MSNYLIDESPLVLLPTLAKKIGLNEAIFVQQVHYFLLMKLNPRDGYYWTYNTYEEWLKQFPFWSLSTLKRIVNGLEEKGLIISGNYNKMVIDKTKWYRINYEMLNELTKDAEIFNGKVEENRMAQNDTSKVSEWNVEGVNMSKAIPNITSNTTTNIKPSRQKFETSDMDNAKLLFKMMQDNNPNVKEPNFEKWANEFRLMRERDGRTDNHIKYMINWCQKDSFWYKNILSPDKLRKQWDRLVLAAKDDHEKKQKPSYQQPQTFRFSEVAQEQPKINKWGIEG